MSRLVKSSRVRLIGLAALLFVLLATAPVSRSQPTSVRSSGTAILFLSSNTEEGLTLEESLRRLAAPPQQQSRHLATAILRKLGAGPVLVHDALGDWEGAVENSMVVELPDAPDHATLRWAAAWFGLLARQKAVLAFRSDPTGDDLLLVLHVPGLLQEVRDLLDGHAIHDRTILLEADRCRVLILDEGGARHRQLQAIAQQAKAHLISQRGRCEILAAPTREEAGKHYRAILRENKLVTRRKAGD